MQLGQVAGEARAKAWVDGYLGGYGITVTAVVLEF